MSKLPSMPFFPADFFADTEHLPDSARHAYAFLLLHAWLRGAKLPNDDAALARMAGFRMADWKRIKPLVMEFWKVDEDGFLFNPRLRDNFILLHTNREINKANGVRGGRPKSLFSKEPVKPNGLFSETETKGYQNQNQNHTTFGGSARAREPRPNGYGSGFRRPSMRDAIIEADRRVAESTEKYLKLKNALDAAEKKNAK